MEATIRWVDQAMFVGESGSGHAVVLEGPPESGGRELGIRPMEMMLLGLGGCTSFDVMNILRKGRADVTDCVASIDAERAEATPAVFTRIHIHFRVTGRALKSHQVQRAIELSAQKYCSASILLERGGVIITHDFELAEAD